MARAAGLRRCTGLARLTGRLQAWVLRGQRDEGTLTESPVRV